MDQNDKKQSQPLIFVVDDDKVLCEQIALYLNSQGFCTKSFYSTSEIEKNLQQDNCALLLLDIMLPGEGGLDFCRRLRAKSRLPIIFMSALGEVTDRVVGLELGADDYIVKPFSTRELLARIRTLLRRVEDVPLPLPVKRYRFSGWSMEMRDRLLIGPDGVAEDLSASEFRLLKYFLELPNQLIEREDLLNHLRRPASIPNDRVLDVQISRLRSKLGESAKDQRIIRTVRGDGYMLAGNVETERAD